MFALGSASEIWPPPLVAAVKVGAASPSFNFSSSAFAIMNRIGSMPKLFGRPAGAKTFAGVDGKLGLTADHLPLLVGRSSGLCASLSTLQRFNASTLQRFNASTLQRFNASTLQSFNEKGPRKEA
jgi:hypothetical protein